MKKLLLIILMIPSLTKAQLHTGIGIGTDFKHAVAALNIGYKIDHFVIEGEIAPSLTRDVSTHNYMGFKAGISLGNIIPSVGYYYDHVSSDKTQLNASHFGYSIKAYKMVNDRGGLFVNGLYIHKSFQLTAGIHYIFN
jgi:hypothetical protein